MRNANNGFAPEVIENTVEIKKQSWLDDPFLEEIWERIEAGNLPECKNTDEFWPGKSFDFIWKSMERSGDVVNGRIVEKEKKDTKAK